MVFPAGLQVGSSQGICSPSKPGMARTVFLDLFEPFLFMTYSPAAASVRL